jgi:hypothetical protein
MSRTRVTPRQSFSKTEIALGEKLANGGFQRALKYPAASARCAARRKPYRTRPSTTGYLHGPNAKSATVKFK